MRPLTLLVLVFMIVPATARSQVTPAPRQDDLLQRLDDQARRLETLEASLAALQAELQQLRGQAGVTPTAARQLLEPAASFPIVVEEPPVEHATDGEPPEDIDPPNPAGDLPRALPIDVYGSLRAVMVVEADGRTSMRNNFSRLGLRGEKQFADGILAFGRYEAGVNLVTNDRAILETGDPGSPIGQGSQAVSSRLGLVGLDTPVGRFSWGKQWAAYYDVAVFTDQFQIGGGAASGAYGAGTDGGLVGTGRAEKAFQYRLVKRFVSIALQTQNRSTSPLRDRRWLDTGSVGIVLGGDRGFGVGAAYNAVRDGVLIPGPNDVQLDDRSTVFGSRYRSERWYAAVTYSILEQHEVDDLGRRFDGNGFELALRRYLPRRFWIEGGYNDLRPDSDHPGDFRIRFALSNLVYQFGPASRFYTGVRIEGSRNSDNSRRAKSIFIAGLNYTF